MKSLLPAIFLSLAGSTLLLFASADSEAGQSVIVLFPAVVRPNEAVLSVISAGLLPLREVELRRPWATAILAHPQRAPADFRFPSRAWLVVDAGGLKGCN